MLTTGNKNWLNDRVPYLDDVRRRANDTLIVSVLQQDRQDTVMHPGLSRQINTHPKYNVTRPDDVGVVSM